MTPAARKFIAALRDLGGEDEGCPICGGALDDDSGQCEDCGADFERDARRFWPGPAAHSPETCPHTYGYIDTDEVIVCGECGTPNV